MLNVVVVCVPDQSEQLEALRAADVPRLVVVAAGTEPPAVVGVHEEWIRLVEAADVLARLKALNARAAPSAAAPPSLDDDGLLHVGAAWVSLSGPREKLAEILLANFGHVVPTDTLLEAVEIKSRYAIRQPVSRLRQSIEPLGLGITFVRPHGYLMHHASPVSAT